MKRSTPPCLLLLLVSSLLLLAPVGGLPAQGQNQKPAKAKSNQTNTDDMWVVEPAPDSLPPRVTHRTYTSAVMHREIGYCIYLPPGYETDKERRYPVIYHLHGAGGNETRTVYSAEVLNEGIEAGRWPEMIMVFPNGGRSTMYQDSADGRFMAETTFVKELMPHIDATYRTLAAREGRCIEGFSMGGRGSTHLAMKFPDLFCSLFNQAGNVYHAAEVAKEGKTDAWPLNYLGSDPAVLLANDPFANLLQNLDRIRGRLRIQVACGTKDDGHLPTVREYHQALLDAGVDHTYIEFEDLAHNQKEMIARHKAVWFDYHIESLRRAGTELHWMKNVEAGQQASKPDSTTIR